MQITPSDRSDLPFSSVGPEGGEGGGRGQREEKKGQNTFFETNSFTQLSIWKQSGG